MRNNTLLKRIEASSSVLGPLFLYDPLRDSEQIQDLYMQLAQTNPWQLALEWPFVDADQAFPLVDALIHEAGVHLDALSEEAKDSADSLTREFRRLFVGPGHKAAAPWESVYTDKDQVVFGESTIALRSWLHGHNISVIYQDSDEPQDHVGTMLVTLAWLTREQPELIPEYLEKHLFTWVPHFLEEMQQTTTHPFFAALAALSYKTLRGMQNELQLQVVTPRYYR